MVYLLDRFIVIIGATLLVLLVLALFRNRLNKHPRVQLFLVIFFSQILLFIAPTVLFTGALQDKDNLSYGKYEHVTVYRHDDSLFSIAAYDYMMPDSDHVYTNTQVVRYEPWIVGYYESDNANGEYVYVYDDSQGVRELIVFIWFRLDDGSRIIIIENNIDVELSSLVVEGETIAFTVIENTKYSSFFVSPEFATSFFTASILFNGIEIGERYSE
jgi:hypothetical protein